MAPTSRSWKLPRDEDLGLRRIENQAGLAIGALPNGCIFAIEHRSAKGSVMVNQTLGSTIDGGIFRIVLRASGAAHTRCFEIAGPGARVRFGAANDSIVWEGATDGLEHRVTLMLHPSEAAWLWRVEIKNTAQSTTTADSILIQDLGLGERGFLMNNEAYASQYIDHHIARDRRFGPVVMSRQNLTQAGRNPWAAHGCLEGARGFATDGMQLFGPAFRASGAFRFPPGTDLPNKRLQHELALAAIQSEPAGLSPGESTVWRFFGLFVDDHPEASSDGDLARLQKIAWNGDERRGIGLAMPARSLVQDAPAAKASSIDAGELARLYPDRSQEEVREGTLFSFFTPGEPHNRHVVLGEKEGIVARRHGILLRSGQAMLPDETTLCATCWMHGVFAAQLTIGNTSFHKLFSVSRDPYNITRASGLRIMIDTGSGWRLLTVPSAFEMGLSDCRWIYLLGENALTIHAIASGEDPAMQWRIAAREPCRFLIFGHLAGGEREFEADCLVEVDTSAKRFSVRPGANSLWGQRYPHAVYRLVTTTPDAIEGIGGGEMLYADGQPGTGAYLALQTAAVREFCFAVTGSLTDPAAAGELAKKYEQGVADASLLAPAACFWSRVTRNFRIKGGGAEGEAHNTFFPWLAQNAMIHLTVPHGLEQYTGAAWGTRDVCQGPVEFLLALEHDAEVKEILRIVFAQQYETKGDWPQWFMLEPYSEIQDSTSHGDVIVWPLKALNDYIETTGDVEFLNEKIAWRREDNFKRTAQKDTAGSHIEKLLQTVCERFIPGTHLIRYGAGDWNDSLQPVDQRMHEWMVSSWTVALLFEQLNRYAGVLRHAARENEARAVSELAAKMRADFNAYLIADGTVAGYAVFSPEAGLPDLLLHPGDTRTGLKYSLLPMTRGILGGLFTPGQAAHHLRLIREHLLFPDGARLMDHPIEYRGGPQKIFHRAESASFFGREIGLMYVHAHLRYAQAMAVLGETGAAWQALSLANPVSLADRLPQATPRQRNAYFSSSDAAFPDRYAACAEWPRAKEGAIAANGGWRVYSSGPGLYTSLLIRKMLGYDRRWGKRTVEPLLPESLRGMAAEWTAAHPQV